MKIGIFDSGLGGLIIAKSVIKKLPKYDYIYLGDTKNLPYGDKTPSQVYEYTKKAVDFLFKQDCELVIVACNTASALALRKIQQKYLPYTYPNRRVLGVVIPTLEEANRKNKYNSIGVIATTAAIKSHIYKKELQKIDNKAKIYELATPELVNFIEKNSLQRAAESLQLYLRQFEEKGIDALVLGCTHYPILKQVAKKTLGKKVKVISQDEIIPKKLLDYLKKHQEIAKKLSQKRSRRFTVTKATKGFQEVASGLFGKKLDLELVKL